MRDSNLKFILLTAIAVFSVFLVPDLPLLTTAQNDTSDIEVLFDQGNALYDLGQDQEAITYYDKVLEIDPNHVRALNSKGLALYHLGQDQEAITYYDKVLEINPNHVNALNNKGLALGNLVNTKKPSPTMTRF